MCGLDRSRLLTSRFGGPHILPLTAAARFTFMSLLHRDLRHNLLCFDLFLSRMTRHPRSLLFCHGPHINYYVIHNVKYFVVNSSG